MVQQTSNSTASQQLKSRIADRSAVIGVIGLGYVGLPLLAAFHKAGFPVIGFDNDPRKIECLNRGQTYLHHLGATLVSDMANTSRFQATGDLARLGECDAVIVCVPTPLGTHHEPDLSYVVNAARDIARSLRPGQLAVLESSTYPGTTRQVMQPPLDSTGLRCGEDFFLAYSPEREDPGRKDFNTVSIPKLVGGVDAVSGELAAMLYRTAVTTIIPVDTAEIAESAKLLENIYRSVNIALVNEMKMVLEAMGIDVWGVIEAAKTKPFGFQAFYPGPGLGGHCIPIDPFYLTWKAREVGMSTRFIELAGEINHQMPEYVVRRASLSLNDQSKAVKGSRILILGLAYKPDVDDVRESPSFELIHQLRTMGAIVDYSDPHVPTTHPMRQWGNLEMRSVNLSPQTLKSYDCVIIATQHKAFNWELIGQNAKLIIDTRNAMQSVANPHATIVKA